MADRRGGQRAHARVRAVAHGPGQTRCVAADGTGVYCSGDNVRGQVTPTAPGAPIDVPTQTLTSAQMNNEVDLITMGTTHGCAIHNTSNAMARRGGFDVGQRTDLATSPAPSQPGNPPIGLTRWTAVSAGGEHTCAILESGGSVGRLVCWGRNTYGQLGNNTSAPTDRGPGRLPSIALAVTFVKLTTSRARATSRTTALAVTLLTLCVSSPRGKVEKA